MGLLFPPSGPGEWQDWSHQEKHRVPLLIQKHTVRTEARRRRRKFVLCCRSTSGGKQGSLRWMWTSITFYCVLKETKLADDFASSLIVFFILFFLISPTDISVWRYYWMIFDIWYFHSHVGELLSQHICSQFLSLWHMFLQITVKKKMKVLHFFLMLFFLFVCLFFTLYCQYWQVAIIGHVLKRIDCIYIWSCYVQ